MPTKAEDLTPDKRRVLELIRQGYNGSYICRETGVSRPTILRWRLKYDWPALGNRGRTVRAGGIPRELWPRILELRDEGMTRQDVSYTLQISYNTLNVLIRQRGWDWPRAVHRVRECDGCKERHLCSQYHCACELPILVLDQPEDALWARNGGRRAMAEAY